MIEEGLYFGSGLLLGIAIGLLIAWKWKWWD